MNFPELVNFKLIISNHLLKKNKTVYQKNAIVT